MPHFETSRLNIGLVDAPYTDIGHQTQGYFILIQCLKMTHRFDLKASPCGICIREDTEAL